MLLDSREWWILRQREALPTHSHNNVFPQIAQIDADTITKSPGLYLHYLRHLRAKSGGWVARRAVLP